MMVIISVLALALLVLLVIMLITGLAAWWSEEFPSE